MVSAQAGRAPADPDILVRVVGSFAVLRAGRSVAAADLGSRKARRLLKVLSAARGQPVPVADLVELLWAGEAAPREPADNVATLVSRLRKVLGPDLVVGSREHGYRLGSPPAVALDLDVAEHWAGVAEARLTAAEPGLAVAAATRAMELLSGDVALADEPDTPWAGPVRDQLVALRRRGRQVLAAASLAAGDPGVASALAGAAVAADPYDEVAVRLSMRALDALGQPARALATYADLRDRLADELGADPAVETQALHLSLLRQEPQPASSTGRSPGSAGASRASAVPRDGAGALGLVGRSDELRRLRSQWNDAAAGSGGLVLVLGEAGIGKTRLTQELASIAASTGGTVLAARCHEAERSLFLQPVVDAMGTAFAVLPPEVVRAAAGPDADVLVGLVPDAGLVLGPSGPTARGPAGVERTRAFQAVTGFLRRLGERGPVLLSLDDLHLAGRETVELLHYLTRQSRTSRVLVMATVRSEEGRPLTALLGEVAGRLEVPALSEAAVSSLATAAGRADLAASLHQRTAGHALSVVEMLRALAAGEPGVPVSLQEAVLARVRRVGPDVEQLLRAAAVLGGSFDPTVAARLLGQPVPVVLARAAEALDARLLVPAGRDLEFANDLVRDVFYDTTPVPVRAAFHAQAADLLTDRPETVALHAMAIEQWDRAAHALLLAGEQALGRYAAADAEDLLTRCLGLAVRSDNREVRGRALLARGRAHEAMASYDAAIADLEQAVEVARAAGDQRLQMRALRALGGEAAIALGRPAEESSVPLTEGLRLATALGDRAMEADFLAWLAILASNALRFDRAVDYSRRAVVAGRASGNEAALMVALDGRKTGLAYLGEIAELKPVLAELEPMVRRLADPVRLHWAIFESGFPALAAGDWAGATARFQEALDACRRGGHSPYEPWHLAHLGRVARLTGRDDEALQLGRAAVALSSDLPHVWSGAAAAALLGTTLLELGQVDEAVAVLRRGRGLAEQDGSQAYLLRCLAPLAQATGDPDLLEQADALLRQVVTPPGTVWMAGDFTYLCIARAWLAAGQPQQARALLAPLLAVAERVPWVGPLAEGSLVDARAAAALGQVAEARRLLDRALDVATRHGLVHTVEAARRELSARGEG